MRVLRQKEMNSLFLVEAVKDEFDVITKPASQEKLDRWLVILL
jgi:hypothetical protein